EALRGEGARLVNRLGEAFMTRYHPDGDLAPRGVVARSIVLERERTQAPICLTLAHLDAAYVVKRFPTIAAMCGRLGLDLAHDLIPVGPAAHYIMGSVDTDEWGRTSLSGLSSAGEAACAGVHGANRLASNSLLEGLVFGARSAVAMQEEPRAAALKRDRVVAARINPRVPWSTDPCVPSTAGARGFSRAIPEIRDLMWRRAGLFRTREGVTEAVDMLEDVAEPDGSTTESCRHRNLLPIARLIVRAALRLEESRGGHFRQDFPNRDDIHWKVHFTDCADR